MKMGNDGRSRVATLQDGDEAVMKPPNSNDGRRAYYYYFYIAMAQVDVAVLHAHVHVLVDMWLG